MFQQNEFIVELMLQQKHCMNFFIYPSPKQNKNEPQLNVTKNGGLKDNNQKLKNANLVKNDKFKQGRKCSLFVLYTPHHHKSHKKKKQVFKEVKIHFRFLPITPEL